MLSTADFKEEPNWAGMVRTQAIENIAQFVYLFL